MTTGVVRSPLPDYLCFFFGVTRTPWFLEANVAPGMTETSLVPQALTAAGEDIGSMMVSLVKRAISRV